MDDSVIMWGEVINSYDDETKTIPKNFNEKKATYETQNFYILLAFLLITIALLIAASISGRWLEGGERGRSPLPFFKNWIKVP